MHSRDATLAECRGVETRAWPLFLTAVTEPTIKSAVGRLIDGADALRSSGTGGTDRPLCTLGLITMVISWHRPATRPPAESSVDQNAYQS